MGLPIIGDLLDLVSSGIDKIWPNADTKEKAKIEMQSLIMQQAMKENRLLFEDSESARKVFIEELKAQGVPKWARAFQVLGRPFALYSTVGMYIYSKISVQFGWPVIILNERDYYLIGTVFVFLFGARTIEKIKGKA